MFKKSKMKMYADYDFKGICEIAVGEAPAAKFYLREQGYLNPSKNKLHDLVFRCQNFLSYFESGWWKEGGNFYFVVLDKNGPAVEVL